MYKLYNAFGPVPKQLYKVLLMMRLTILLLVITLMQVSAKSTLGQRVRISVKDVPLEAVIDQVSLQLGVNFLSTDEVLSKAKPVTLDANDLELTDFLALLFEHQPLTYEIANGSVVIKAKPSIAQRVEVNFPKPANQKSGPVTQDNSIRGNVYAEQKPLMGASIILVELQLFAVTDEEGYFQFTKIPQGTYTIRVNFTGMKPHEVNVSNNAPLSIHLQPNTIEIEDVLVVGERSDVKGATSTRISRQAIEHLQATNLSEVLQLIPGQTIANPNFARINAPSIRQISGAAGGGAIDANARNVASLGTSILVNGAQLSNNADMQAVNTAVGGTLAGFNNSTGLGTDLRQITADNIESIEVIRGIPSVEYGELTSGVIDITTKASVEPLQAKLRLNPSLRQAWVGQGFRVGNQGAALFVDVDYTHAAKSQIRALEDYQRITSSFQYTDRFGKNKAWYTNSTLSFGGYYDDSKTDPDLAVNQVVNQAENYDIRFSTNGRWNADKKWMRNLHYVLSAQLGIQHGFQQQMTTGDVSAVSGALTNVTQEVDYLPSSFLQKTYIDGKPFSLQAKLSDNFYFFTGRSRHALTAGASYSLDKNFGDGRYFGEGVQPKTNNGLGYRPRKFSDVPGLNQLAIYLEDRMNLSLGNRPLNVLAGIRYDAVQPGRNEAKSAFSPRFNISYEPFGAFKIRGGYGWSAKAPTLIYLYPDPVYVDIFSLNYYKEEASERLALMTTRVFSAQNDELEMVISRKAEVGMDYKKFSLTLYQEKVKNGLDFYQYYNFATVPVYSVVSQAPGQKPQVEKVRDSLYIVDYNRATNGVSVYNKGVEFEMDLGRIQAIRTSFILNGAFTHTKRIDNNPFVFARRVANQPYNQLGVFEGRGKEYSRFLTTLRGIHHIPEIKMLVSLTAQTIWIDKDKYLNYNSRPYGVIDVAANGDGKVRLLSPSEIAAIPETSGLYLSVSDDYYREESWRPLWLINTKVTKEFGKYYGFSFYVNNIVNDRPYLQSKRNPTQYEKRNIPIYFGSELTVKF